MPMETEKTWDEFVARWVEAQLKGWKIVHHNLSDSGRHGTFISWNAMPPRVKASFPAQYEYHSIIRYTGRFRYEVWYTDPEKKVVLFHYVERQ